MFRQGSLASVVSLLALAAPAAAQLPTVSSGHRPGPDILYAPPVEAPQLDNIAPWVAEPILVSGTTAYRDGEFLYQDFLHDDAGATGTRDPEDPNGPGDFLFSPRAGTALYPDHPVYANNAADLVELRVKPLAGATAFRVTLNTLKDPERTAFTIAIGGSDAARTWPHGAGVSSPAELFLTVHGSTAELMDAGSGAARPGATASVDMVRRQIDVRIPHSAWNPGSGKVRLAAGVGLWDTSAGRYHAPQPGARSETTPGGGRTGGPALFNVAFRFDEPMPDVDASGGGVTIADAAVGAAAQAYWWREFDQATTLATGDISKFFADVDFAKLAAGTRDDSAIPKDGPMNRILASRFSYGQGVDHSKVCFDVAAGGKMIRPCEGRIVGQLQPYAVYIPRKAPPPGGHGITLLLHSLSANYNQYLDSKNQSQLGERGAGTIVVTPSGRGPDGFYTDVAEADAFEVWADVARRFPLDPTWAVVSGYSMGGIGTYRMLSRWPDLFARGMSTVGAAHDADALLPNLRNTPIMAWAAAADELVNVQETEETKDRLAALGLRFVADLFETADHLTLATNDEYGPAAEFLGEHRVDRAPPHVTYVTSPEHDYLPALVKADHAYWVSGLQVRDRAARPRGTIDVRSEGFGVGDPQPGAVQTSQGVLTGGSHAAMPYLHRVMEWGPAPATPKADRLVVKATNISSATIDLARARLSCSPQADITSDGPFDLKFDCPPSRLRSAGCRRSLRISLPRVKGRRVVRATVTRNGKVIRRARGRNLRRLVLKRPTRATFTLRVKVRTNGGREARTVTVVRRYAACR